MATLRESLVSFWALDEASGNALDSHGSNTLIETSGTIGTSGGGRDFEAGDTEYFSIPPNQSLNCNGTSFTIAGWVTLESKPANAMAIASKWLASVNKREYSLVWLNTTDRFQFQVNGVGNTGGNVTVSSDLFGAPSTATRYFVCAWYDAELQTINIQVNGGKVNSAYHTAGILNGESPFNIGALGDYTPSLYFDGVIQGVGLWKRVLTSLERTWLYNSGTPRTYSELTADPSPSTLLVAGGGGWNWCTTPILAGYDGKLAIGSFSGLFQRPIVTELNTETGSVNQLRLGTDIGEIDDHDQPCLLQLASGKILAVWAVHNGDMWAATSTNANDATAFGSVVTIDTGTVAYAQMLQVNYNNTVYLFHRGGLPEDAPQYLRTSADDGATWSSALQWLNTSDSNRPYPQYAKHSSGDRIDFVTTNGHPRVKDTALYSGYITINPSTGVRAYYKTDGTLVGNDAAAPFQPEDFTLVYDDTPTNVVWGYDLEWIDGELVCLFAKFPDTGHDPHEYWRGKWNGSSWTTEKICDAGTTAAVDYLYAGEGDTYSGGLCFHPLDSDVVYASREYGSNIFRIQRWERVSGTWTNISDLSTGVTANNCRPESRMVNNIPYVVWWAGRYTTYLDYDQDIYFAADPDGTAYPVCTVAPAVTGTEQQGQALSVASTWENATSTARQWYEVATEVNSGGTPISGQTGSSLTLTSALVGKYIYCVETATSGAGSNERASNVVGPIVGPAGYEIITPDNPSTTLTNWFYVINANLLSVDWWKSVKPDGGDVWAYDASDNRLPVYLRHWDYANRAGNIYVGYPTKLSTDEPFRLEAGYPSRTQPAPNASYGQYAVFPSAFKFIFAGGADDLTAINHPVWTGAPPASGASGLISGSKSMDLDGSTQRGESTASVPTAAPMTMLAVVNPDNITANLVAVGVYDTNSGQDNLFGLQYRGDIASDPVRARITNNVTLAASDKTSYSASAWQTGAAVFASTTSRTVYLNGVAGTTDTTSVTPVSIETLALGVNITGSGTRAGYFDGKIAMAAVADVALPAAWIAYWHEMMKPTDTDQSDFYTLGGWTENAATGGNSFSSPLQGPFFSPAFSPANPPIIGIR